MNPDGQFLVRVLGIESHVMFAIYDNSGGETHGAVVGGVRLTPEQARTIASRLTWESMAVEEGKR